MLLQYFFVVFYVITASMLQIVVHYLPAFCISDLWTVSVTADAVKVNGIVIYLCCFTLC